MSLVIALAQSLAHGHPGATELLDGLVHRSYTLRAGGQRFTHGTRPLGSGAGKGKIESGSTPNHSFIEEDISLAATASAFSRSDHSHTGTRACSAFFGTTWMYLPKKPFQHEFLKMTGTMR